MRCCDDEEQDLYKFVQRDRREKGSFDWLIHVAETCLSGNRSPRDLRDLLSKMTTKSDQGSPLERARAIVQVYFEGSYP